MARPVTWGGDRAARITRAMLEAKGQVCHLCGYPGATSADHDPPRSVLLASGVTNPDALAYLKPAHLTCNQRRRTRAVTDELRDELRRRYEADTATTPGSLAPVYRSSRWVVPGPSF